MASRRTAGFVSAFYNPLQVPNAPTIGVATNNYSGGSANVTFTAPTNVGGNSITNYVVLAKKTSDGTTVGATGTSSPITVTGLTNNSEYSITVAAVNSYGPSPYSSAVTVTPTLLQVGDSFQGGYFAGTISTSGNGVATHRLVVAPASSGQAQRQWKTDLTATSGTSSEIDGPTNSSNMNNASHPAASFCEALSIGGYSDWYMPAKNELEICYYNLKPSTTNNVTDSGINPNAVPSRASNYTSGTPSQTSANDFKTTGTEDFELPGATSGYWSSTQEAATTQHGKYQSFADGQQYRTNKNDTNYVRAVRRVAV